MVNMAVKPCRDLATRDMVVATYVQIDVPYCPVYCLLLVLHAIVLRPDLRSFAA